MSRLEIVAAIIMLVLAAIMAAGTAELAAWEEVAPGPRFMPLGIAGLSALLAVLLILEARANREERPVEWPDRPGGVRVTLAIIGIVAFLLVTPWLGFVLGSAAFALFMLLVVIRRRLLPSLLTTVITAAMIQGIFISWLSIPLPKGVFGI
jgi:hypothetical protein